MAIVGTTPTKRSPKKSSPKRSPLQERTQSQANEISARLARDTSNDPGNRSITGITPFPTKPAHVLLPSTIKRQRTARGTENDVSEFLYATRSGTGGSRPISRSTASRDGTETGRTHTLTLKRSVTALRDMYEAQAERSRPPTATSPPLRPTTSSSRLRAMSSSEGLSGRYASWTLIPTVSSDDLALLPSLDEAVSTVRKIESQSSFASRTANLKSSSSPNYRKYGPTSSPKIPIYNDLSDPTMGGIGARSDSIQGSIQSSSPNFIRIGRSSSIDDSGTIGESSSSPNVIKLGSSSPTDLTSDPSSNTPSISRSNSLRKRKRADTGPALFSTRNVVSSYIPSSPPYNPFVGSYSAAGPRSPNSEIAIFSSPPKSEATPRYSVDEVSPVSRGLPSPRILLASSPADKTHANLQSILSSSPGPTIQYPIVTAPISSAMGSLSIPKRQSKSTEGGTLPRWSTGPSTTISLTPSDQSKASSKSTSKRSSFREDLDDFRDSQIDYRGIGNLATSGTANFAQTRPVLDDHHHEATDELSALPGYLYKSIPVRHTRSATHLGTSSRSNSLSRVSSTRTSLDARLNSLKSFYQSQQMSIRSLSWRPTSSTSSINSFAAPSWARRYYSGLYRDSHHYPYLLNDQVLSNTNLANRSRPTTAKTRHSWHSFRSLRNSFHEVVTPLFRPRNRPRLEARKSHGTPGIGPLVSNPVAPESAVVRNFKRADSGTQATIRRISVQFPAVDPRAHWAGVVEELEKTDDLPMSPETVRHHYQASIEEVSSQYSNLHSGRFRRVSRLAGYSPHLHHDRRLNTGSSTSRGFGHPFNRKLRWDNSVPSLLGLSFSRDHGPGVHAQRLHLAQVVLFISGFAFPPAWFCAAFLRLPARPNSFTDIEKDEWQRHSGVEAGAVEESDIVSKLRMERHNYGLEEVRWQSTRWWRTLNRFMSVVGVVVCTVVIVLAVVGTSQHW